MYTWLMNTENPRGQSYIEFSEMLDHIQRRFHCRSATASILLFSYGSIEEYSSNAIITAAKQPSY